MLRVLLICVLCIASAAAVAQERLIVAAPSGDPRLGIRTVASSVLDAAMTKRFGVDPTQPLLVVTLAEALERARPGTLVRLLDGVYDQRIERDRLNIRISGSQDDPVIISGPTADASAAATIDGAGLQPFEEPLDEINPDDPSFRAATTTQERELLSPISAKPRRHRERHDPRLPRRCGLCRGKPSHHPSQCHR